VRDTIIAREVVLPGRLLMPYLRIDIGDATSSRDQKRGVAAGRPRDLPSGD
jgi:hypothetical protein